MKAISTIALAALAAVQAAPALAQTGPEYPAKFVCGRYSDGSAVAYGNYSTSINIRNAGADTILVYEVADAPVGTQGSLRAGLSVPLSARHAIDLDCRSIRAALPEAATAGGFYTCFLTVSARQGELDVVAVYTATRAENDEVVTLHTERVPPRRPR